MRGDVLKQFPCANKAFVFHLITAEAFTAMSGDELDGLPAWHLQPRNKMQQVLKRDDWTKVGGRKGGKMRQDNEREVMSYNSGEEQNGE